jgi:hypothetical protein
VSDTPKTVWSHSILYPPKRWYYRDMRIRCES